MKSAVAVLTGLVVASFFAEAAAAPAAQGRPRRRSVPVPLVFHVETLDGRVVASSGADEPINPASIAKVATTLWALERLGPGHRFETRFRAAGTVDRRAGVLRGDLEVEGGADPDFHAENALLVAARLNELGVRRVTGKVVVNERFWMGWEGGSAGRLSDPRARALRMGARLRRAFDPRLWDRRTRAAWRSVAARHGLDQSRPPSVTAAGGVGFGPAVRGELLVVHRSPPLAATLRRFNCYSNNDIERIAFSLGSAADLARLLSERLEAPEGAIRLETTSGLGRNRMSPRLVVQLLRLLRDTAQRMGLDVEELLPVAGCDPGTVAQMFPKLVGFPNAASVVGKTGTLTATDGGVSVFAGFASAMEGDLVFCVAAPRSAGRLRAARREEERFVIGLLARHGGPRPRTCAAPLGAPDAGAEVTTALAAAGPAAPRAAVPAHRSP